MSGIQHFEEIKALLGNSGIYYLIAVGMDSNYSYLNKRYADIFKLIHGNLVGEHYAQTIHPDDTHICQAVSELAFKHRGSSFPATLRKHDGKGGFIITRWEYKALFDDAGIPIGIFCIGHDISELMQITGELQQIKITHSHSIRRYVANLIGLGNIIQQATEITDMQDAAKMIVQCATDLDKVVREIHNKVD